LLIKYY
jgi:hypothetical protein